MEYTVDQILRLRAEAESCSEHYGEPFHRGLTPDVIAHEWAEVGWSDPAGALREYAPYCPDARRARDLRDAGVPLMREVDCEVRSLGEVARRYYEGEITLDEAKREAGSDPLLDLADLKRDRDTANRGLEEIRRLAPIKAREAREAGASVAEIGEAFGVSRQGAYDLLG